MNLQEKKRKITGGILALVAIILIVTAVLYGHKAETREIMKIVLWSAALTIFVIAGWFNIKDGGFSQREEDDDRKERSVLRPILKKALNEFTKS